MRAGDVNVVELDTGGMLANGDVGDLKTPLWRDSCQWR